MFMLYCNMSLHFIVMYVALLLQHDIICLKFVDNSNFISLYLSKKYKGEKIKFSTTQPYQYQDNNISQQLSYSPTFLEKLAVLICFSWYSIHNGKYFKSIIFQKEQRSKTIFNYSRILMFYLSTVVLEYLLVQMKISGYIKLFRWQFNLCTLTPFHV